MADSVISRPGADLAYDIDGDGPLAGYSHGLFFSRAAEDAVDLVDLRPLLAERRLLRYDARGHGKSGGDDDPASYTWDALADARTDLPPAEALETLAHPTLILAWAADPVHPVSTAEYLVKTLPNAQLHISETAADVRTWPSRAAAFLRL